MSLRAGTVYTVNIGGGSGAAIVLKGSAHPFEVAELRDGDIFDPVRTQSGYVRIYDDGTFDWSDIIPVDDISRPVTLTDGNGTVVWQGFMQAQDFSGHLYGTPQEREFPVQCVLSVLSTKDIDATNRDIKNFAYLIRSLFSEVIAAGITINNYYFAGGTYAIQWLLTCVDWQNFISLEDGVNPSYDKLTVLEDVCKFWGWQCRTYGQDVYFTSPDDTSAFIKLTEQELSSLAEGNTWVGTTTATQSASMGAIVSLVNDEVFVRGPKAVKISANINKADQDVIAYAPDSLIKTMSELPFDNSDVTGDFTSYWTTDTLEFTDALMIGSAVQNFASFCLVNIQKNASGSNRTNVIENKPAIRIYKSGDSPYTLMASLESTFEHNFYDVCYNQDIIMGGIGVACNIYVRGQQRFSSDWSERILVSVGVGKTRSTAKWYNVNSRTWVTGTSIDNIRPLYLAPDGQGGKSIPGFFMPTNFSEMNGRIFLDIYGSDNLPVVHNERSFFITDLSVGFVKVKETFNETARRWSENKYDSNIIYKDNIASMSGGERNIDTILVSDNNADFGYGVVIGSNGIPLATAAYPSGSEHPEQHLVNRFVRYWATPKKKITIDVDSATTIVSPDSVASLQGGSFYPLAIGRTFRDDITTVTLIKI